VPHVTRADCAVDQRITVSPLCISEEDEDSYNFASPPPLSTGEGSRSRPVPPLYEVAEERTGLSDAGVRDENKAQALGKALDNLDKVT
jgi:hypothetical protein